MQRICVYCGSNRGTSPVYAEAARGLADALVHHDFELVYGGAAKGIMGVLADAVLANGGAVHGVIPKFLQDREIAHGGLTQLHVVASMHERKTMMAELADGFVALPGGFGTIEELIEIVTWAQLRFHEKPCGILNVNGYFDDLLRFFDRAEQDGFLRSENRGLVLVDSDADGLLGQFERYTAPCVDKWIDQQ